MFDLQKKNKRREHIYEKLARFLEVPQELVKNVPVFVIRGRHEIEISGCSGITEYSDDVIELTVGRDKFTVRGNSLELADFRDCVLYVRGNIDSAAFEGGGE